MCWNWIIETIGVVGRQSLTRRVTSPRAHGLRGSDCHSKPLFCLFILNVTSTSLRIVITKNLKSKTYMDRFDQLFKRDLCVGSLKQPTENWSTVVSIGRVLPRNKRVFLMKSWRSLSSYISTYNSTYTLVHNNVWVVGLPVNSNNLPLEFDHLTVNHRVIFWILGSVVNIFVTGAHTREQEARDVRLNSKQI